MHKTCFISFSTIHIPKILCWNCCWEWKLFAYVYIFLYFLFIIFFYNNPWWMLKFVLYLRKFPDVTKQCLSIKCSYCWNERLGRKWKEWVSEYSNKWKWHWLSVCYLYVYMPSNTFQDGSIVFSLWFIRQKQLIIKWFYDDIFLRFSYLAWNMLSL